MEQEYTLEQLFGRHRAFWEMAEVDRPLLSVGNYRSLQSREPFPLADGSLTQEGTAILPERVDARRLVEWMGEPSDVVGGDFIRGTAPYDLCWSEAIAGCPIRWRRGHVWSESFWDDLSDLEGLRLTRDNLWLAKLLELTDLLVERAGGLYPVGQPLLRGPIDIAAAVLGDERLCWAMVDEPEQLRRLFEVCTDLFIEVAEGWRTAATPFQNGYCKYGIWAPGTAVRTQCDNAALMSPQFYQDFLIPCDERICARFDYPLMHTHACFVQIVADALLSVRGLRAIQVSLDYPAGPSVEDLLPTFEKINRGKPLIITGGLTEGELNLLMERLSPRGLCLQVSIHD